MKNKIISKSFASFIKEAMDLNEASLGPAEIRKYKRRE